MNKKIYYSNMSEIYIYKKDLIKAINDSKPIKKEYIKKASNKK